MKITAESLAKKPAQAYRAADKGETVVINHDRYPDKVFELTARERRSGVSDLLKASYEQGIKDNMLAQPKTYTITDNAFEEKE